MAAASRLGDGRHPSIEVTADSDRNPISHASGAPATRRKHTPWHKRGFGPAGGAQGGEDIWGWACVVEDVDS